MRSRVCGAVLLLTLLAGCSSDDGTTGDPPGSGADPGGGTSTAPTTDGTTGASDPVAPAAGRRIRAEGFGYRLPEGRWELVSGGRTAGHFDEQGRSWQIGWGYSLAFDTDLDTVAANALDVLSETDDGLARGEDRTVAGVEGYVIEGSGPDGLVYEFGTVRGEGVPQLWFRFPEDSAQAREWIESVLASVEWAGAAGQ